MGENLNSRAQFEMNGENRPIAVGGPSRKGSTFDMRGMILFARVCRLDGTVRPYSCDLLVTVADDCSGELFN